MTSIEGPKTDAANQYIEAHKLIDLFQDLTAKIIYDSPEDPKSYLVQELKKIKADPSYSKFFSEEDLRTIFDMYDKSDKEIISKDAAKSAYQEVGVPVDNDRFQLLPDDVHLEIFIDYAIRYIK